MENKKEIKNVGIVFSGGFARGSAQLAFAREIINRIGYDKIKVISASSIGAINAYSVSVKHVDEMLECYKRIDAESVRSFTNLIRRRLYDDIYNKIQGEKMLFPVYVSGTKLFEFNASYFCLNNMPEHDKKKVINCSMAFPLINGPHTFNKGIYIDGGATDNIPTYPLQYFDLDLIIILHCYPKYYPDNSVYEQNPNAVIVDVDVTLDLDKKLTSFSFSKEDFAEMEVVGEKAGKEFTEKVFKDLNKENIRERCFEYTNEKLHQRYIKSGDGLMSLVDVLNALYRLKENY